MGFHRLCAISLLTLGAWSTEAAVINITFDVGDPIGGLAAGTILGSQYSAYGVTFSPNAFSGPGGPTGAWATNSGMKIVSSGGADVGGLGTPALVSGNLLRSFNDWLGEDGDASFLISFSTPVDQFSAVFAGIATASSTRIFAYNGATLVTSATAGGAGQQLLSISGVGQFDSVRVTPGDFFDWVGVDNISFQTAAVPEPSTFGLVGVAGLLALARLRRR